MTLHGSRNKFQFHTGSIKSLSPFNLAITLKSFQFHTGSIKRETIEIWRLPDYARFNSILVRLKVATCINGSLNPYLFQFHTGSIKSHRRAQCQHTEKEFQFHTGSIKSSQLATYAHRPGSFQFHTGSIKREM